MYLFIYIIYVIFLLMGKTSKSKWHFISSKNSNMQHTCIFMGDEKAQLNIFILNEYATDFIG